MGESSAVTVGADFNQVLQINLAGTCAGRPVRNDARLGEQTRCCTKALSQRVPRAAGASRWGVGAWAFAVGRNAGAAGAGGVFEGLGGAVVGAIGR
ncbi:hypothetical protein, partial [Streptomyces sp. NPDC059753]|uniref:hypothetical protein n=1 Tax=Streptomyces sp. NPDC059753 TaxID=3346933 RepID=UPI0036635FB8